MKQKLLTIKTLLVGMGLMAGVNGAWADYYSIYSNDYEDAATFDENLTFSANNSGVTYKACQITDGDNHYLKIRENTRNGGNTSLTFPSYSTTDYQQYVLSFKVGFYTSNNKSSSFQIRNGSTTLATFGWGTWNDAGATISYTIGSTAQSETLTAVKQASGTRNSDTKNSITKWYTFTITGSTTDGNVKLTVNDGSDDVISNSVISDSYITITSLYATLGNAHAEIGFDDMNLQGYSENEVVPNPSATITGVNGTSRTVTLSLGDGSTDGTTLAYSTNSDMSESTAYNAPFEVTTSSTIYYQATSPTNAVSGIFSINVQCSEVVLNTPTWTKTSYSEGVTTLTLASNQSNVLLSPTADIYYQINDGVVTKYTAAFNVNDGDALTYYAAADGYTNSVVGSVKAYAPFAGTDVWTENYTSTTDKLGITLGDQYGTTGYYYMVVNEDVLTDKLLTDNTVPNNFLQRTSPAGIYSGTARKYAIPGLTEGQYVVITTTSGTESANPTAITNLEADTWNNSANTFCFYVTADGMAIFNINRYCSITSVTVKSVPAPASETVSVNITDAGWATVFSGKALDFSGVEGLTAYTATLSGNTVTLTKVDNVPAETGVVLKADEGDYYVPVAASSDTDKGHLMGSLTADIDVEEYDGWTFYVLSMNGDKAQFRRASSGSILAGKAYLQVASGEAPALQVVFADAETTGIGATLVNSAVVNNEVYNLAGLRVDQPTKGLYIVNGKKVVK